MIITFDGLAGTGKSTLANRLSKKLNFSHLDTGIFFRTMALYLINNNFTIENICSNASILEGCQIEISTNNSVKLEGCDVTKRIREKDVTNFATELSRYEIVSKVLYDKIRDYCKDINIVADGRCLGTKILPHADIKFFINSPIEERAKRRSIQFDNLKLSIEETINQFIKLDEIEKEKGALIRTSDMIEIQNYNKTEDEVFKEICDAVDNHMKKKTNRRMRLLVTHNCNYKCLFCHNEGICDRKKELLTVDDYAYLCSVVKQKFDIDYINISGGEPLLRNDIIDIAKEIKKLGCKVALTTNAYLLNLRKEIGKYLDIINISFHANDKDYYEKITGTKDTFENVRDNIKYFRTKYPNLTLNLNVGYSKEVFSCENNVISLINMAIETGTNLKFIEIFPRVNESYLNMDKLKKLLKNLGYSLCKESIRSSSFIKNSSQIILERCFCSEAYYKEDPKMFCNQNNDLFVSSDGAVTLCRNSNNEISMLQEIKNRSDDELSDKIKYIFLKLAEPCCCKKINERE